MDGNFSHPKKYMKILKYTPFKKKSPVGFYRVFVLGLLQFEKKMKTTGGFHLSRMSRARRKKSSWISSTEIIVL
jgi:hypothetical protein